MGNDNTTPNGHPYQKFPPTGEQVVVAATTPSNLYSGLVSVAGYGRFYDVCHLSGTSL